MPNYANTVIYKICCKNTDITDIYVGHTTNIKRRIILHKDRCNNPKDKYYHLKVYEFIRNNGGFDNWDIIVLEEYPCNSFSDAIKREREYYETLKATLNMIYPQRTNKEYKECKKQYNKEYRIENSEKINEKKREKVICECGCEIRKGDLKKHQKTKKHIQLLSFKHQPSSSTRCFTNI